MAKESLCLSNFNGLPPEAAKDVEIWRHFNIKSTLAFPLYTGGGEVFGVVGFGAVREEREWPEPLQKRLELIARVFANAIERKHSELKLRESEARLSLAAASANAGLWTLDPATGQIWATEKTYELFGLRPDEDINLDVLLALVHPEDVGKIREIIQEAMRSGAESAIEYRILRPDGTVRWIAARGRRQPSGDGGT